MFDKTQVSIVQIPGLWISIEHIIPPENANEINSKELFQALKCQVASYDPIIKVVNPVMPAINPKINHSGALSGLAPIKNSQSPFSEITKIGYCSGRRSAIIPCVQSKDETDWWIAIDENGIKYTPEFDNPTDFLRVKGCGMWIPNDPVFFPGFTYLEAKSAFNAEEKELFEVRGCAFSSTAATELYATKKISEFFDKCGIICGNSPLGTWNYGVVDGDISPKVSKYVIIMKTLSDMRLETHFHTQAEEYIYGLDPNIINESSKRIHSICEKLSLTVPNKDNPSFKRASLLDRKGLSEKAFQLIGSLTLLDFQSFSEPLLLKHGYIPSQILLQNLADISEIGELIRLYYRIGIEAGRSLSAIHRAGFLWGTYVDHDQSEIHCNSHPDNFLILSPDQIIDLKHLLAAVDFDMSFEPLCSVSFWGENSFVPDPTIFKDNISSEFCNLMCDLCGLSATYPGVCSAISPRAIAEGPLSIIIETLRDISGQGFIHGYIDPCLNPDFDFYEASRLVRRIFTNKQ